MAGPGVLTGLSAVKALRTAFALKTLLLTCIDAA